MKYYFPIHLNGGNRGCEGIARGTAQILGQSKENMISLCTNIDCDKHLGLDALYTLQPVRSQSNIFVVYRKAYNGALRLLCKNEDKRKELYWKYTSGFFLDQMQPNDIMISTGGDMLCYDNNEVIFTNDYLSKKDVKTVLWGCSMGIENLTPKKLNTLKNFDLLYTRESLTYDFFKSLGLKNVICYPDPAFILKPEEIELPICFNRGDVLGLNISNYVMGGYDVNTKFGRMIIDLIKYILDETKLHILLIPHVTWEGQNDIVVSANIKKCFQNSDRITILDISNLNYCKIRYVISKCKFFVGARTHAVISAYSTCVPTIALGYSIKSKGIAKDLNIDKTYVVDSKRINNTHALFHSFLELFNNSDEFKYNLGKNIPNYINQLNSLKLF